MDSQSTRTAGPEILVTSMIPDEWSVELDGVQYTWRHSPEKPVSNCWEWTDDVGQIPAAAIIETLNSMFVEQHPLHSEPFSLLKMRHPHPDMDRWRAILESMGAQIHTPGGLLEADWQPESPLKQMGYRVGNDGLSEAKRRSILRRAVEEELGEYGPPDYIALWGDPRSPERLRKIAENIASYCRNMKRRKAPSDKAISDWEADLAWLKVEFREIGIVWPSTTLYRYW